MKNILLLIVLFPIVIFAQGDNIKGKWILDYVTYENGDPLEIEHPLFSTFKSLDISDKHVIIDGISKNKSQVYVGRIVMQHIKYKYHIDNKYLVLKEDDADKLYYFLRILDFKKKYPDTKSEYVEYENRSVLKYNRLLNIDILNSFNFDSVAKFQENIKSYKKHLFTNKLFKATFILTADNMGKYWPKRTDAQIEFFKNKVIADYYYTNKQFNLSKEIYTILYSSKDVLTGIDNHIVNEIYKKLYISLLHTNNLLEACILLNDIKETNYFEVKNYLKEYCP